MYQLMNFETVYVYVVIVLVSCLFVVHELSTDQLLKKTTFEPAHEIMVLITQATSEGSGEPAHLCSRPRAFAVRTNEVWK